MDAFPGPDASPGSRRRVRLALAYDGAEAVYLMGAFNDWSTTRTPMQRVGADGWEAWVSGANPGRDLCLFVWEPGQRHGRLMHVVSEPAAPLDALRR